MTRSMPLRRLPAAFPPNPRGDEQRANSRCSGGSFRESGTDSYGRGFASTARSFGVSRFST